MKARGEQTAGDLAVQRVGHGDDGGFQAARCQQLLHAVEPAHGRPPGRKIRQAVLGNIADGGQFQTAHLVLCKALGVGGAHVADADHSGMNGLHTKWLPAYFAPPP